MIPSDPGQLVLAVGFVLLAFTAGALIVRGWGLGSSYFTLIGQLLIVLLTITLWPALLLAEIGHFSLLNLDIILLVLCLVTGVVLYRRRRPLRPLPRVRFSWPDAILIGVLIGAGLLFARPGELIVGGEDPGVYVNTGIHIARTGAIIIKDELLAAIPAELSQDRLYSRPEEYLRYVDGSLFPGFYVLDAGQGRMVPQFFHLFPAAIAILYELGGVPLALYATPLLALASLFMLYLLGRELAGRSVGLLAAGLLGLNISQIWFARIAFSDVVLQFWLLAGLWTLSLLIGREPKGSPHLGFIAILSGVCFGMAHLTKLDSYVVPVIVVGYLGVTWLLDQFRRSQALLAGTYLVLAVHAAIHASVFSAYYVYVMFSRFTDLLLFVGLGAAAVIGALLIIARYRLRLINSFRSSTRYQAPLRVLFVAVVLAGSLYLYFVRPLLADVGELSEAQIANRGQAVQNLTTWATEPGKYEHLGRPARTFVEEGMVRMGWYLTPLGVWLGIAGLLIWALSKPDPKALPFLAAVLVYSAIVFYQGAIRSDFFWAFKRYVPLVIPSFMVLIAYVVRQFGSMQTRVSAQILPVLIVSFLGISYAVEDLNVVGDIEYEGATDQIAELNEIFASDAVILYQTSASTNAVGTPLRFAFGRAVYPVPVDQIDTVPMQQIIQSWLRQGLPVYWVTPADRQIDTFGSLSQVGEQPIEWRMRASNWEQLPIRRFPFAELLQIYQIQDAEFRVPVNVDANLGNEVILLGYELADSDVAAGGTLRLDLYWYALHPLEKDYTVFAHVLDDATIMRGQWDGPPLKGARPTSDWIPGEIIHDRLTVPISADTPPGSYSLSVGLYEWPSVTRLPLLEDGQIVNDRIILTEIQVRGAD